MNNLKFKTNYNILLWHFVDSLSMWDYHIMSHIPEYYVENWNMTAEDKKQLVSYQKIRSKLNCKEEMKLFAWAENGFKKNKKYNLLLEHLKYFENRKNKEGVLLKDILTEQIPYIKKAKSNIISKIKKISMERIILKMEKLFDIETSKKENITIYLPSAMSKHTQGGASYGDRSIYIEIPEKNSHSMARVLTHEYLHLKLPVRKYLDKFDGKFYKQEDTKLHRGRLSGFFDEVIIYILSDTVLFKTVSIKERIGAYRKLKTTNSVGMFHIWTAVKNIRPIIVQYLDGELKKQDALKNLHQAFLEFYTKYQ